LTPAGTAAAGPSISWQSALAACDSGDAVCDTHSTGTVTLAKATVTGSGTAKPDGSIAPIVNNRMVYAITFTGVPCVPAGRPAGSPASKSPTPQSCTIVNLVDTHNGAVLFSAESPTP
jgi:hypothetical protein